MFRNIIENSNFLGYLYIANFLTIQNKLNVKKSGCEYKVRIFM